MSKLTFEKLAKFVNKELKKQAQTIDYHQLILDLQKQTQSLGNFLEYSGFNIKHLNYITDNIANLYAKSFNSIKSNVSAMKVIINKILNYCNNPTPSKLFDTKRSVETLNQLISNSTSTDIPYTSLLSYFFSETSEKSEISKANLQKAILLIRQDQPKLAGYKILTNYNLDLLDKSEMQEYVKKNEDKNKEEITKKVLNDTKSLTFDFILKDGTPNFSHNQTIYDLIHRGAINKTTDGNAWYAYVDASEKAWYLWDLNGHFQGIKEKEKSVQKTNFSTANPYDLGNMNQDVINTAKGNIAKSKNGEYDYYWYINPENTSKYFWWTTDGKYGGEKTLEGK